MRHHARTNAEPRTREAARPKVDELDFLSNAAVTLAEIPPQEKIFRVVAEQLAVLAPESMIITNSFEPSSYSTVVQAVAGPSDMIAIAREELGRDIVGLAFRVAEDAPPVLGEGKLIPVPLGLHQATFYTWSVELSRHLEARLGVRSIHGQPFARRGDFLGTVCIISRAPRLENARLIEAFIRVAAGAIQRLRLEARLYDSESRFRMLAENSQDVIFRLKLKPRAAFEYVSPAATNVIGVTPRELYADPNLGAKCLYPEEWTSGAPPRDLPPEPVVVLCRHRDGTYTWTEQNLTLTKDERGDVVAIEGVVRDITKRKEAEDALVDADRRKNDFLAVLSHELRNPLSPIRNGLYILERAEPASEQANRARAVIARQITHLTRLIDDLLDVTRITRGKVLLKREHVELNQLVRATVEDHRSIFAKQRIELEVVPSMDEVWINGDKTRIAQIVGNLLLNAAKFTPPGGRTSVVVSAAPATSEAVLAVRDTGVGISHDILPRLFEPFTQADTTLDRSKGGLGLGLMLVKGLAVMHGGSVTAKSDGPGKGAEFTVRLPLETATPLAGEAHPLASGAQVRVLIVEDNVDAAETLREALGLRHDVVEVASTGPEGIDKARTLRPDVILCDIGLPGLDGYGVARAIRAIPELRGVGLVALTGYTSPEDVAKSRAAGFDRHLSKPPSIDVLERVLSEVANRSEERSAMAGETPRAPPPTRSLVRS